MYAKIHSFDRFCRQAAQMEERKVYARPAVDYQAAPDGEWHLRHEDGRWAEFRVTGDVVDLVIRRGRATFRTATFTREHGRSTYSALLSQGFRKW